MSETNHHVPGEYNRNYFEMEMVGTVSEFPIPLHRASLATVLGLFRPRCHARMRRHSPSITLPVEFAG
jgi:hypothetical protein